MPHSKEHSPKKWNLSSFEPHADGSLTSTQRLVVEDGPLAGEAERIFTVLSTDKDGQPKGSFSILSWISSTPQ